jgi:NADPH-dependent 2,4-dienoyl-CoA reductase/sulfur reductase-like enzyme
VHVLRTIDDATALQRTLRTGPPERVVVIGGGFTACEVAATARELGRDVTIVARPKTLLGKVLGTRIGERIGRLHRTHGVDLALGAEVVHWIPQPRGIALHLSNGELLLAGCVVLAVGSTPAVQWLRGSGLTLEDGLLCRPSCHVVGATDVVAAGDVARWPNLRFEAVPRRAEHWLNAAEMGRAAAASLLAGPVDALPFTPLPRFWSEQFGVRLQVAGMPTLGEDTIVLEGRQAKPKIVGHLRNGRLIGVTAWDSPPEMLRWTAELERELLRPTTSNIPKVPTPVERKVRADRLTQLVEWQLSRGERVEAMELAKRN